MDIMLNIGCGMDIKPKSEGWINIDMANYVGVDRVINFNKDRIINHFDPETVKHIYASHFLEHLINPGEFIDDCTKILKRGGTIEVRLPSTLSSSIYHRSTGITKGYFYALKKSKNLQGGNLYSIKVKKSFHYKGIEYLYRRWLRFTEWFNRQIFEEYIFYLKKK